VQHANHSATEPPTGPSYTSVNWSCAQSSSRHIDLLSADWLPTQRTRSHSSSSRTPVRAMLTRVQSVTAAQFCSYDVNDALLHETLSHNRPSAVGIKSYLSLHVSDRRIQQTDEQSRGLKLSNELDPCASHRCRHYPHFHGSQCGKRKFYSCRP